MSVIIQYGHIWDIWNKTGDINQVVEFVNQLPNETRRQLMEFIDLQQKDIDKIIKALHSENA